MLLPIVVYGHPVLRKIADDIPADFPDLDKFLQDMFQTMDEADGVGLAAPQVGKSIRVFVIDGNAFAETDPECAGFRKAFINAHIIERSGEEKEENYEGIKAWIIQHEYDHLEGILFTDHLSSLKKRLLRNKFNNISLGKFKATYRVILPK